MGEIEFTCRKCGHRLILNVGADMTAKDLLKKLREINQTDCPSCGEEPWENWTLSGVAIRV